MFLVFEVSRPFQLWPGMGKRTSIVHFRVLWLWFAISLHPGGFGRMIQRANRKEIVWK